MLKVKFRNRVIINDIAINMINYVKEDMIVYIIQLKETNMILIHRICTMII